MFKSLRTKLVVVFILLALGPLLLMSQLALSAINSTHRQDVATLENQALSQKAAETQKFLSDVSGLFDIHVGYQETSIINAEDQKFLLSKLLDENSDILDATFVDMLGQETAKNSQIQDASITPLSNISLLPGFKAAHDGKPYFGRVRYTLSGPVMAIAAPVLNANNVVIMVITGQISLEPLIKIINLTTLGNSGYLYLLDAQGTVLASANPGLAGQNLNNDSWINNIIAGGRHNGLDVTDERININGQTVLSAGLPLKNPNWSIVAEWPKDDAFAVVKGIQNQVILFSLIAACLVALMGWLVGRSILNPLIVLKKAAGDIGQGHFDFKINIKTGDELETLGQVFNGMTVDLKHLQELREEFVFVAAHELRTPVTAIKGYLSMIKDGEAGEVSKPALDLVGKVLAANQRLIQLVEDLLQVAKTESGRLTIAIVPTNLTPVVQSVLSELAPLAKEKNIQLIYAPVAFSATAMADSDRVKEILINLVGNAIKYTTTNTGTVTVAHEVKDGQLITNVADTGLGMSPEEQTKLFSKFYRIKNTDTAKISGTGLGLFIVKQLVEKMGGKIWVTSVKGKGSTFSFSLAYREPSSKPKKSAITPPQKP